MKMADRAHANLPNKKPPWWSTQEYGIPMNYGQSAPRATTGGRKLMSVEEITSDAIVRHAPGIPDLTKKEARLRAMEEEERKIDPNRIEAIEKQLRDEVARHTPYHERKTTILIRAFQTFDHDHKGTLTLDAFRRALQCFNVELTPAEGRAVFRKFGQDGQRRLPYQVFTRALFTSKSRLLAWTAVHHMNTRGKNGLPKGSPFIATANAQQKAVDRLFDAKIQPLTAGGGHCVQGLYPPSNWATSTWEERGLVHPVVRARQPPDVECELEHVYGYNGGAKYDMVAGKQLIDPIQSVVSPNLFFTSTRGIVYSTAAVGVVLEYKEESDGSLSSVQQRFFQAHSQDILCLKCDDTRNYCATGQAPIAKRGPNEMCDPFVCVWDLNSMQELMQLPHAPEKPEKATDPVEGVGGIQAVCFSEDGQLIISAARNTKSTIFIWRWRQQKLLFRADTKAGVPPQVYGVKWNTVEKADGTKTFDFASFGNKHINFWFKDKENKQPDKYGESWSFEPGSFINKQDPAPGTGGIEVQDVMCVEFLANGNIVTGMASGDIYLWKPPAEGAGMQCDKRLMIPGADPTKPKVKAHMHTVQVLKLRFVRPGGAGDAVATLLSGGGGGKVKIWKDLDGEVPIFAHELELPKAPGEKAKPPPAGATGKVGATQPPAVKALDCFPGLDDLVVGTDKCDIFKIKLVCKADGSYEPAVPTMLVKGHADDCNGLDVHPKREYLFASAALSGKVNLWDAKLKSLVGQMIVKNKMCTCCTFRGDAKHLAVGCTDGSVFVYRELNDWEGDSLRLQKVPEMGIWPLRDCISDICEIKYSPDLRSMAVASHDTFIDLYDCADSRYLRLHRCKGHSATVSHIDWASDSRMLQSQCNAYELLYWNTDRGDPEEGYEIGQPAPIKDPRKRRAYGVQVTDDQRDTKWDTWSCNFGFDVMGIWPSGYINTEINYVHRSPLLSSNVNSVGIPNPKQLLAASTNRGEVMVFNYPVVVARQPMHRLTAHSSFVQNVKWLRYKDTEATYKDAEGKEQQVEQLILVSAGGHDKSIMQWKVRQLSPPTIDDPAILKNEGNLKEAKKVWYYKYTGNEWVGDDPSYEKAENIYHGNVGPAFAKGGPKKKELDGGGAGGAAGAVGAKPDLSSASAADLKKAIKDQEDKIAAQQKQIAELQAQLKAKG